MTSKNFLRTICFALFATSIILGGCRGDDNVDDDDDDDSVFDRHITAKIENASDFSDVTKVKILAWDNGNEIVLATADFKDGGFTLNLPERVNSNLLYLIEDYFSMVTISNKNAKWRSIVVIHGYNKDDEYVAFFRLANEQYNSEFYCKYLYVDSYLMITGDQYYFSNGSLALIEVYDISLKKGWNVLHETRSYTEEGVLQSEFRTSPAIEGMKWFGYK